MKFEALQRILTIMVSGVLLIPPACSSNHLYDKLTNQGGLATGGAGGCLNAVASDSLSMVCVPGGVNFSMGSAAVSSGSPAHTVLSITAYAMARFEVKYADWLTVKTWATSNGYTFANPGVLGSSGSGSDQQPIVCGKRHRLSPCAPALKLVDRLS